jgi:hypothetical protein
MDSQVRSDMDSQVRSDIDSQVRSDMDSQVRSDMDSQVRSNESIEYTLLEPTSVRDCSDDLVEVLLGHVRVGVVL